MYFDEPTRHGHAKSQDGISLSSLSKLMHESSPGRPVEDPPYESEWLPRSAVTQDSDLLSHKSHPSWSTTTAPGLKDEIFQTQTNVSTNAPDIQAQDESHDPFLVGFKSDELNIRSVFAAWWLEAFSLLLAIGMLFAIVGIVYPYDGKPLPQWPFSLSINALVSSLAVVLKVSLVLVVSEGLGQLKWLWFSETRPLQDIQTYDDASRGPLGALKLIWTLRGRHILSSVAAATIVILLITDPLSQLLIQYRTCSIVDLERTASIPRSNVFAFRLNFLRAGRLGPTPGMQAAINAGIFNPESAKIAFDCPTGDCDFSGSFKTIGYCSTCTDISREVSSNIADEYTVRNYYLPSGLHTNRTSQRDRVLAVNAFGHDIEFLFADQQPYKNNTCSANDWGCNDYGAARCELRQCVHTLNSTVRGGNLTEHTLEIGARNSTEWGEGRKADGTPYVSTIDLECAGPEGVKALERQGYSINKGEIFAPYNTSFLPNESFPVDPDCVYQVGLETRMSLMHFWDPFFSGSAELTRAGYSGPIVIQQILRVEEGVTFDHIAKTLANVTATMTTYMRQNGVQNYTQPFSGRVTKWETCAQVNWAWISFPAALIAGVFIFFVLMITETRKMEGGGRFHKSKVLPLLFYGLEYERRLHMYDTQREDPFVRQNKRMEKEAKHLRVKLVDSWDGRLQFVASNGERSKFNGQRS